MNQDGRDTGTYIRDSEKVNDVLTKVSFDGTTCQLNSGAVARARCGGCSSHRSDCNHDRRKYSDAQCHDDVDVRSVSTRLGMNTRCHSASPLFHSVWYVCVAESCRNH